MRAKIINLKFNHLLGKFKRNKNILEAKSEAILKSIMLNPPGAILYIKH